MSDHVISPAAELLGREILSRDPATGEVCVRFTARREFYNRSGIVHGGFIAAMLDSVTGIAVSPRVPEGSWAVTARLDTHFLKRAGAGPIFGATTGAAANWFRLDSGPQAGNPFILMGGRQLGRENFC